MGGDFKEKRRKPLLGCQQNTTPASSTPASSDAHGLPQGNGPLRRHACEVGPKGRVGFVFSRNPHGNESPVNMDLRQNRSWTKNARTKTGTNSRQHVLVCFGEKGLLQMVCKEESCVFLVWARKIDIAERDPRSRKLQAKLESNASSNGKRRKKLRSND